MNSESQNKKKKRQSLFLIVVEVGFVRKEGQSLCVVSGVTLSGNSSAVAEGRQRAVISVQTLS